MEDFKIGKYKHYKGNIYVALAVAKHSETLEELVVYHPENSSQWWVRPRKMFEETVEVEGKIVPRFQKLDN